MDESAEILQQITTFRDNYAREFGIIRIGVFGSTARHASHPNSDVDIVVEIKEPDLFTLIGIQQELEKRLNRSVDIVRYRDNMNAFLKKRIERDAVYV